MRRWVWYVIIALAVVFYRITILLITPFALAFLLAAMLNPVVVWLCRVTPLGRTAATAVVFALGGLVGGALLVLATAALVQGVASFIDVLPAYSRDIMRITEDLMNRIGQFYLRIPPDVLEVAKRNIGEVYSAGQRLLTALGQTLMMAIGALPAWAAVFFISLLAAFFLTKDWEWALNAFRNLLPREWRQAVDRTGVEVGTSLGRYILAQTIVIAVSTGASIIGLLIIGVHRWLAAGLVAGLLDLIPVLGPALLYVPWAVYSWAVGERALAISLLVLYGVISGVRQFVEPKVVGDKLGIHPLVMMAGIYWGSVLFGAKGLFLAPLVLIVGKAILTVRKEILGENRW